MYGFQQQVATQAWQVKKFRIMPAVLLEEERGGKISTLVLDVSD